MEDGKFFLISPEAIRSLNSWQGLDSWDISVQVIWSWIGDCEFGKHFH